jgi:hypothetical protein
MTKKHQSCFGIIEMNSEYVIWVTLFLIIILVSGLILAIWIFSNPNLSSNHPDQKSIPFSKTFTDVTFYNLETTGVSVVVTINHNSRTLQESDTFTDKIQPGTTIMYTDSGIEGEYVLPNDVDKIYFTDTGLTTNQSTNENVTVTNKSDSFLEITQSSPQDTMVISNHRIDPQETGTIPLLIRGNKLTFTDDKTNKDITYSIDANPISSIQYNGDQIQVNNDTTQNQRRLPKASSGNLRRVPVGSEQWL